MSLFRYLFLFTLLFAVSKTAPLWDQEKNKFLVEPAIEILKSNVTEEIHSNLFAKRRPGESPQNPIEASFDTKGWEDTAEFDCYTMLCVLNGNRV
jgi:hypothetical protein